MKKIFIILILIFTVSCTGKMKSKMRIDDFLFDYKKGNLEEMLEGIEGKEDIIERLDNIFNRDVLTEVFKNDSYKIEEINEIEEDLYEANIKGKKSNFIKLKTEMYKQFINQFGEKKNLSEKLIVNQSLKNNNLFDDIDVNILIKKTDDNYLIINNKDLQTIIFGENKENKDKENKNENKETDEK